MPVSLKNYEFPMNSSEISQKSSPSKPMNDSKDNDENRQVLVYQYDNYRMFGSFLDIVIKKFIRGKTHIISGTFQPSLYTIIALVIPI